MSDSLPPDDTEAGRAGGDPPRDEPGRRRSWRRRLARGLAVLVLVVVAPILAALVLLHLPVGRSALQAFVERTVGGAVAGELKLGTLDYNLLRGRLDTTGVALEMEGLSFRLERGEARFGPWQGARLRLVRPVIVVRDTGKPTERTTATGIAARPWSLLERLARADVVDGRLEMQDANGAPYAVVGDLDASMQESGGARPIRVTIGDGVVGAPGSPVRLRPVRGEARLAVGGGRLRIDSATLSVDASSLDASGVMERLSPNEGDLTVRASVDGTLATSLSPGTEVAGRVEADASVRMAGGDMTGTLRLATPGGITAQGLGPWVAAAQGHFDAKHLVVDSAEVTGYSARITAKGAVAIDGESSTDVELRVASLDIREVGRAAVRSDVPVRAILDGSLRYTTKGLDVDAGRATGSIALRPALPAPALPRRRGEVPGVPLAGSSDVAVEGRRVRLRNLRVEAHNARIVGDVELSPELEVEGRFEATVPLAAAREFAADLGAASPPPEMAGTLSATGEIRGSAKDPTASFRVLGSGIAPASTADKGAVAIEGEARYARGRVSVATLAVRSGDGEAVFVGGIPVTAAGGSWDVRGDVRSLDLGPLLAMAGVEGRGPLNGQVFVGGSYAKPSARADLDARVALSGNPEPLAASVSGTFADGRLAVARLQAEVAGGRVEGTGSFDTATRAMEAKGAATDLQIARLPHLAPSMPSLQGVLGATFALTGTPEAPVGDARASVAGAAYEGQPLPDLVLVARADGRRLELTGSSTAAAAGDPPVAGDDDRHESVFLRGGGTFEGDWPLHLEVDVAALPTKALLEVFEATRGASVEARGTFVFDVAVRDPQKLGYAGRDLALTGKLRELEWSTGPFRVEGTREQATIAGLRLTTRTTERVADRSRREEARAAGGEVTAAPAGGTLSVEGRVPIAADRTFDLAVRGSLDLAVIQALSPEARAAGTATLEAHLGGTLEAPDVQGTFGVAEGRGRLGGVRVNQVAVQGRLQGREAFVDQASARVLGGSVSASGSLPLAPLGEGREARLRLEAKDVDLSRMALAAPARTPDAPSFFVSMTGEVIATAPRLESIRAEGRFTRIESTSPEGTIALVAPAAWRLVDGRFVQEPIRLSGPLGTLEARAEARLTGDPGGSAAFAGPFDLRMISPFVPDTTLAGPARVDVRATWSPKAVRVDGGLFVEDGRLTLEELQFTASQIGGAVRFLGDRATLEATAAASDGKLVASGGMTFGPSLLGPAQLKLEAQRIPITYPEGFRGRASGTILVAGDVGNYEVTGDIAVSQAYYTAEFDQRRQSLDRLDYQLAAIRGESSMTESLPLGIDVKLVDPLRIRNSQAQLDIVGTLRVGGTLAQPVTSGQVSLLEGGRVTVRRARVRPQEGRVELNGYPSGVPEVDFTGVTQVGGVAMSLRAQGSMEDLQLDISSPNRPDLSQSDLISLLLTGRTAQAAASQSGAIVAEELAAALGGALQKGVGETFLIDVSNEQSLLLDDSDPTQRFNVGTRLRQDLAVIYSTRLDGTEQRWVVEWNPRGGRFRLRGIDDRSEGYMVELTDRFSFNVFRRRTPKVEKTKELRKLGSLRLEGTLPLPEKELRDDAGLKVGRRYDPVKLEQAADKVREKLVERGWRAATVDAISDSAPDAGRVGLVLRVTPGPHVAITWTGDEPGDKIREQAVKAWPAYASPEAAAAAVARAARVALQAEGFYDAKVEPSVKTAGEHAEVAFAVTSGVKGSRVELAFDGNTALTDDELAATMPKPGSREFFEALDRSTRLTGEARIAYANAGYLRARVGPARPRFDAGTGVLTVTIPVRERGPSRVTQIELPPEVVEAGESAPALRLREGEPFDVEAYLADRDAIAAWYRREGWMEARVRGVLQPAGDDVDVAFPVEAGPRPRRGDVRIASDGRTSETLIRRQVEVEPGAIIRPQELSQTRARLSEMDVFTSVDVRSVPVDGQPDVSDLEVSYVERPDVTVEYGLRYDFSGASTAGGAENAPSQGRLQVAAGFELANPLGWGWRFKAYTLQTTSLQNYRFGVESSSFLGKRLRTQVLLFDEADDESAIAASFASKVRGFSIQQSRSLLRDVGSRRWHDRLRLQWGYTNKDIQYSEDVGSDVLVAGNRAFLSASLIGDWRDSLTDPRRGVFWTATTELARRFLGSDVDYNRFYGQLFAYVPLPAGLVWAQGWRAGVVPGDDPFYLLENRFQAGGPTTVRGFRQNGLGPQFDEDEGFGGQGVLVLNQELRFPIWRQLHGGIFWDAGNTWLLANEFSFRDVRHSVGAGLRFMLPFGPIRIEYGFILDRRKNSDGTYVEPVGRLVFGLGHAF